jgi:hypothetical protein
MQYANNLNSGNNSAQTSVDLRGVSWPVLRFRDRHALYTIAAGDRGVLEVSPDGGNWTRVYGVSGTRGEWAEQRIDLSLWRGQANLRIRFYVESNSAYAEDGWAVDDIAVEEHVPGSAHALPFSERFEAGLAGWIGGGWVASTNAPFEGAGCARDLPSRWTPVNTESWLTLGRELDLSGTASPQITLWARGNRGREDCGRLYVRLSKDGGLTWLDLSGVLAVVSGWTRFQYTVPAPYCLNNIRLQLRSYAYAYELEKAFYVDAIGIGVQTPGVPILATPAQGMTVTVLRPMLTVTNAIDYQSDPLTYHFEVYTNAALSAESLVAENPAIASGAETTSWQLDTDLPDETQYWWRCRVTDSGNNVGAWSEAETFFVGLVNAPPEAPLIVSPYADATLPDASGYFVWFASADPDTGDEVVGYQIQIAADAGFTNVLVEGSAAAQPSAILVQANDLPGYDAVALNARYYWRVRAYDLWDEPSAWTASSFIYGTLPDAPRPDPVTITDLTIVNGWVSLTWTASANPVRIEQTPSLTNPQWTPVPGAEGLSQASHSFNVISNASQGFFRVVPD